MRVVHGEFAASRNSVASTVVEADAVAVEVSKGTGCFEVYVINKLGYVPEGIVGKPAGSVANKLQLITSDDLESIK